MKFTLIKLAAACAALLWAFAVTADDAPRIGYVRPLVGTDGFGTRFAAQCGGKLEPLYPCLTALQTAKPNRSLAGIRAKGCASLLDGADGRVLARETGEVQFTDYGLSGICIMQLSGLLAPGRGPKAARTRPAFRARRSPRPWRQGRSSRGPHAPPVR